MGDFMATIYYYAKNESLPIYLKYGIRLSKNFDKELNINGYIKQYLIGYLNPKDNMQKYNSNEFTCIKLEVLENHVTVIDSSFGLENNSSYSSIDKYIFGTFRLPLALVDTSIMSDKISLYNKVIDVPLLYDNSEEYFYELNVQKILNEQTSKDIYEKLK